MSVEEVLKAFGGAQAVAAHLGMTVQAVSNMKARGAIPGRHWQALVDLARAQNIAGITFEALAAMRGAPVKAIGSQPGAAA